MEEFRENGKKIQEGCIAEMENLRKSWIDYKANNETHGDAMLLIRQSRAHAYNASAAVRERVIEMGLHVGSGYYHP